MIIIILNVILKYIYFLLCIIAIYQNTYGLSVFGININYNTSLIKPDKFIYSKESEVSFNGDGEQYFVMYYKFSYKLDIIKSRIILKSSRNSEMEEYITNTLERNNIPLNFYPDFNLEYKYYYIKKADNSKLCIVNIGKYLYVLEVAL